MGSDKSRILENMIQRFQIRDQVLSRLIDLKSWWSFDKIIVCVP
jgi:hypothetical protein